MPPSPYVDIATGITVVFGTSGFDAQIVDVGGPGITRESVDVTHQGSVDAMEFEPADLPDYGELTLDIHFNPDLAPPVEQPTEEVVITWPAGATWTFDAFGTNYEQTGPINDKQTGTLTLKITGKIVRVSAP